MDNEQDRIRLAEVLGWTKISRESNAEFKDLGLWGTPPRSGPYKHRRGIPDPFTDANDDYAVLEAFRSGRFVDLPITRLDFEIAPAMYYVGDYARAVLGALSDPDTGDSE